VTISNCTALLMEMLISPGEKKRGRWSLPQQGTTSARKVPHAGKGTMSRQNP
jgi:hypothetical protein